MLREIFENANTDGPVSQRPLNMTPVFRLAAAMPEFAAKLSALLAEQWETALAERVADLWAYDRCRCGAEYCATVYTTPKPEGGSRRGLGVFTKKGGVIYIDLAVNGKIACIEALDQPEIRRNWRRCFRSGS